eukprot:4647582-Lingulodinium_polyedra.AAC.1
MVLVRARLELPESVDAVLDDFGLAKTTESLPGDGLQLGCLLLFRQGGPERYGRDLPQYHR